MRNRKEKRPGEFISAQMKASRSSGAALFFSPLFFYVFIIRNERCVIITQKTSTQVPLHSPKKKKTDEKCFSSVFYVTIACSGDHEEEEEEQDGYFIDFRDKFREQEEEEDEEEDEAPATTAATHTTFLHS